MANLLYRVSLAPSIPGSTTVKSAPLTNLEIDANFKSLNDDLATKAATSYVDGQVTAINTAKNAVSGYAGIDATYRIQFKNSSGVHTSLMTNVNTAIRTYTFQDRNGVIADDTDLAMKATLNSAPTFTGNVNAPSFSGNLNWSYIIGRPSTAAGYGITDVITTGNIGAQSVAAATNATNLIGSGTISDTTTINGSNVGYRNVPSNTVTVGYTTVMSDAGKHIQMTGAGNYSIAANSSVPYVIGTTISFFNTSGGTCTISCPDAGLYLAGLNSGPSTRTVAPIGLVTFLKFTATQWVASGSGVT